MGRPALISRQFRLWLWVAALCALPGLASAAPDPHAELERGRLAYGHGDYKGTIALLRPLVYPSITLAAEADVVDTYKLMALSYFFENDEKGAEGAFKNLLQIAPSFELDPLIEPPPALAFFREVRKKEADLSKELELRRERERKERERKERERKEREARLREAMRERLVVTRTERRNIYALNFVPFGVPQFQNGHRTKGYVLLASQLTMASLSAGIWAYQLNRYPSGLVPNDEVTSVNQQQVVHIAAGGVFLALYAYGVWDGIRNFKAVEISERQQLVRPPAPPGLEPGPDPDAPSFAPEPRDRPAPSADRKRSTTYLSPFVTPDGAGLGVGGIF